MAGETSDAGRAAEPKKKELLIGAEVPDAHETGRRGPSTGEEPRAVRRFALRVAAFSLPIVLLVVGVESLWWRVGETWPLGHVIRSQRMNSLALFGRGMFGQGTFRYKYLEVLSQKPAILVVGSSRVMQFRREMFGRQGSAFYNAGGIIHSLDDLRVFLERLPPDATPKIVILAVDFWWFNENEKRDPNDTFAGGVQEDGVYSWQGHAFGISNYLRHAHSLEQLIRCAVGSQRDPNAIGLEAATKGTGFRPDGSRRFALKIPKTPEAWKQRRPGQEVVVKRIRNGGTHFPFTAGLSVARKEMLREALLRLQERGVFVIAYSPPIVTECARVASTHPRQKEFWSQYHAEIPALFRSLNIPFLDIITPADLGLDDRYMRDPFHPHETFDLYLLQRLCQMPEIKAAFPDIPQIAREVLSSPRTNPLCPDLPGAENVSERESADFEED